MNIYKNFIDKDHCNKINNVMLGIDFPWFYAKHQTTFKDSSFMGHCFYKDNKINSSFYYLVEPIINKLNPTKIINIRCALCLKRPMTSEWHSDFTNATSKDKVAVYYVNTNNGYTIFKNKKIKSEKNKIVIFDGNMKHKVKYQTDKDTRTVINCNYESI